MLSQRWLTVADLTDEAFLTEGDIGGGDTNASDDPSREPPPPADDEVTEDVNTDDANTDDGPDGERKPKPLTKAQRAALVERLADLDDDDYDLEREPAAEQMGGIRLSTLDKMVEKLRQARANAAAASAAAAAAAALAARKAQPPEPPPPDTAEVTALIAEFNANISWSTRTARPSIYAPKHDPDQNRRFFERITFADLDKLYLNRTVLTG